MIGYGTYNLPPGTWSDDSSLAFCLADSLVAGFDIEAIGQSFIQWLNHNHWTARGYVFDVGITTRQAIYNLSKGVRPDLAGGMYEDENGNGSLMRILPLIFYIHKKEIEERYQITRLVSSITHGHIRSVIACFYYLEFARGLLLGQDKYAVYKSLQSTIPEVLASLSINPKEIALFSRLLNSDISIRHIDQIRSSGLCVAYIGGQHLVPAYYQYL